MKKVSVLPLKHFFEEHGVPAFLKTLDNVYYYDVFEDEDSEIYKTETVSDAHFFDGNSPYIEGWNDDEDSLFSKTVEQFASRWKDINKNLPLLKKLFDILIYSPNETSAKRIKAFGEEK